MITVLFILNYDKGEKSLDELKKELATSPDYALPEPQGLMTAKNYKTKFAEPLIKKLKNSYLPFWQGISRWWTITIGSIIPTGAIKIPTITAAGLIYPEKTEEDYEQELKDFIASTGGTQHYEFEISNLCPGECKWMNSGMLIKPIDNTVTISYRIQSSHSTGDLKGNLSISLE